MENNMEIMPGERIADRIFIIRGKKVMLDFDLAVLYGVKTKDLKRAAGRNKERFPEDFSFILTREEWDNLRCQFGTSSYSDILSHKFDNSDPEQTTENLRSQIVTSSYGGTRYLPIAFTEQGVAMLSSVLKSKRAIAVNIQIIRIFTRMRELMASHADLVRKLDEMESLYDAQFREVFATLKLLIAEDAEPKQEIGFVRKNPEPGTSSPIS